MDTRTGQYDDEEKKQLYIRSLQTAAELKVTRTLASGGKVSITDFDLMHAGLGTRLDERIWLKTKLMREGKILTSEEELAAPSVQVQAAIDALQARGVGSTAEPDAAEIKIDPGLRASLADAGIHTAANGRKLSQSQVERWLGGKSTIERMHLKAAAAANGILDEFIPA